MTTFAATLAAASKYYQAGDYIKAEPLYRQIVQAYPTNNHNVQGQLEEALACLGS
jgi:hypothetical protein